MSGSHENTRARPRVSPSRADIAQIVDAAFRLLEDVGVAIDHRGALAALAEIGADVSAASGRVRIPRSLVTRSIESAPDQFDVWDIPGDRSTAIGGAGTRFNPGSSVLAVLDRADGTTRPATTTDLSRFARVTDRLAGFAFQSTCLTPSDVPESMADRFRLFVALAVGSKPIVTGTFNRDSFPQMLAMLQIVRGNAAGVRKKPPAIFDCCPTSPLSWSELTCDTLICAAQAGIPACIIATPLAGATAPVTLAGAAAQQAAENLSGVVIHQAVAPGAPLIFGNASTILDMRLAITPFGAVEATMLAAASVGVGRFFKLPTQTYAGMSDAKVPDYQAGMETAAGLWAAVAAGADVVAGPGMLNFLGTQSLEKLVCDHDACMAVSSAARGFEVSDETLAVEEVAERVKDHAFVKSAHTRRHFRTQAEYPSELVDRLPHDRWIREGSRDTRARARSRVEALLADPPERTLDAGTLGDLECLVRDDARRLGLPDIPDWRTG